MSPILKKLEDQKLAEMLEVIFKYAAGDLTARGTLADDDSAQDGVMAGINILGEELQVKVAEAEQAQQALEEKVQQLLESQEALEQYRAHLEQVVAQRTASLTDAQRIAHLGNWEWDLINNTLNWSDEMYRIFGYAPQQIDASYKAFLNAVHPDDRQRVDDTVHDALARQHTYSIEHRIRLPDGTLRYVHGQAELIRGKDGQPISMLGTVQDITERKLAEAKLQKLQEQLREQALHDPLTGLYNRRYLDETINRELARAGRYKQPIGIVMCDLDYFKNVNDTYGHLAGDKVLRVFAELLKKHARSSDIVCRFGGEEFVMFLPDMPPAVTYQRAEQLRTELAAKRITLGATVIQVTASFGVAAFPENGKTMDSLISAVDAAMYQAKEAGRNRIVVSSAHEEDIPGRTEMGSAAVSRRKDKRPTGGH